MEMTLAKALKHKNQFYRTLDTKHGKRQVHRFAANDEFAEYKAVMRKETIDRLVADLESDIDKIQDQLDEFNMSTKITIGIPDAVKRPYAPISD